MSASQAVNGEPRTPTPAEPLKSRRAPGVGAWAPDASPSSGSLHADSEPGPSILAGAWPVHGTFLDKLRIVRAGSGG